MKVVSVRVVYDDGAVEGIDGPDAHDLWTALCDAWMRDGMRLGCLYKGPRFKLIRQPTKAKVPVVESPDLFTHSGKT